MMLTRYVCCSAPSYQDNIYLVLCSFAICTLTTSFIPGQGADLTVLLHAELAASNLTSADTVKHNRATRWQKRHAPHVGT